jgi:hypothetical protein
LKENSLSYSRCARGSEPNTEATAVKESLFSLNHFIFSRRLIDDDPRIEAMFPRIGHVWNMDNFLIAIVLLMLVKDISANISPVSATDVLLISVEQRPNFGVYFHMPSVFSQLEPPPFAQIWIWSQSGNKKYVDAPLFVARVWPDHRDGPVSHDGHPDADAECIDFPPPHPARVQPTTFAPPKGYIQLKTIEGVHAGWYFSSYDRPILMGAFRRNQIVLPKLPGTLAVISLEDSGKRWMLLNLHADHLPLELNGAPVANAALDQGDVIRYSDSLFMVTPGEIF